MTNSLDDDVHAIYRHKRGRKKNVILKVSKVVRLVARARWKRLKFSEKVRVLWEGGSLAPSWEDVYIAVHRLMETNPHFYSLSTKHRPRSRPNSKDYLHLVHSA